jgi:hypothetical protein
MQFLSGLFEHLADGTRISAEFLLNNSLGVRDGKDDNIVTMKKPVYICRGSGMYVLWWV